MHCDYTVATNNTNPTTHPLYNHATPPHTLQTRLKAWKFGRKMLRGLKRWMPACLIRNSGQRVPCRVAPKITFLSLLISSSLYLHHLFILAHMTLYHDINVKGSDFWHCCHGCSFLDHHARLPIHQVGKITKSHKLWLFCCSEIYYWYKRGWVAWE